MLRLPAVLFFVVLTFICWGSYGPVLHIGQEAMGPGRWRPFICVGMAYFIVAVVVPMLLLQARRESGRWTVSGIVWSLIAGAVGALGALGIIIAFVNHGKPVYIMPIVFGCAPVVNTLVTMGMNRLHEPPPLRFYLAVLLVALGAAGVFVFKPQVSVQPTSSETAARDQVEFPGQFTGGMAAMVRAQVGGAPEVAAETQPTTASGGWLAGLKAFLAIGMTAACWGAYGPILHKGQAGMEGSRLRPFVCVGLAYFIIAVLVPMIILSRADDGSQFNVIGVFWSMLGGAVGAIGALGIIMAFNYGGRPIFVMPLVFGGAPVVNTIISMSQSYLKSGQFGQITSWFLGSLILLITGAVCVLIFARARDTLPRRPPRPSRSTNRNWMMRRPCPAKGRLNRRPRSEIKKPSWKTVSNRRPRIKFLRPRQATLDVTSSFMPRVDRVFLYEFVTGGGLLSEAVPPSGSLLREGVAMLRAVTEDLCASRIAKLPLRVMRGFHFRFKKGG